MFCVVWSFFSRLILQNALKTSGKAFPDLTRGPLPNSEAPMAEGSAANGEPAGDVDRDPRRPRRYLAPGESRLSERFRTQPVTSAERLRSDR